MIVISIVHWLSLSLTPVQQTRLMCEDINSKLVKVVTVADVDDEDHVGNSLL